MAISKYLANELNDHVLRNEAYTAPTSVFLALFTAITGLDDNSPTSEVSGNNYSRLEVGGSTGRSFSASSNKATSNSAAWEFPQASGSWGTVSHVAVMSASTSGNVLYYGALTTPRSIVISDVPRFLSGELDILFS